MRVGVHLQFQSDAQIMLARDWNGTNTLVVKHVKLRENKNYCPPNFVAAQYNTSEYMPILSIGAYILIGVQKLLSYIKIISDFEVIVVTLIYILQINLQLRWWRKNELRIKLALIEGWTITWVVETRECWGYNNCFISKFQAWIFRLYSSLFTWQPMRLRRWIKMYRLGHDRISFQRPRWVSNSIVVPPVFDSQSTLWGRRNWHSRRTRTSIIWYKNDRQKLKSRKASNTTKLLYRKCKVRW